MAATDFESGSKSGFHRGNSIDHYMVEAAKARDASAVQSLLSQKADISREAIMATAAGGNVEVMGLLVEAKANLEVGVNGESSREWANPLTAAIYPITIVNGKQLVSKPHASMVQYLIQQKMDVNASNGRTTSNFTPLTAAISQGDPDTVRALLNAGAVIDTTPMVDGQTPRDMAVQWGHHDIAKMFDTHAKLNARKEKKAAAKAPSNSVVKDERDLDDLLAFLDEKPGPVSSNAKKNKAKGKSKTTTSNDGTKASDEAATTIDASSGYPASEKGKSALNDGTKSASRSSRRRSA